MCILNKCNNIRTRWCLDDDRHRVAFLNNLILFTIFRYCFRRVLCKQNVYARCWIRISLRYFGFTTEGGDAMSFNILFHWSIFKILKTLSTLAKTTALSYEMLLGKFKIRYSEHVNSKKYIKWKWECFAYTSSRQMGWIYCAHLFHISQIFFACIFNTLI